MADGPAGFTQGFTCPVLLRIPLSVTRLAHTGLSPSMAPLSKGFWFVAHPTSRSYNPEPAETGTVWTSPVSLAATTGITFVFSSSGYLDVSVPRVRLPPSGGMARLPRAGLPHSETPGSPATCASPGLIAACHVLPRLRKPRHPPCALTHFPGAEPASPAPRLTPPDPPGPLGAPFYKSFLSTSVSPRQRTSSPRGPSAPTRLRPATPGWPPPRVVPPRVELGTSTLSV